MSVIVEFSIFPLDKGESLSRYVARAIKIIKDGGLPYELNPMGTCVEGQWKEVMALVDRCFQELQKDCGRINLALHSVRKVRNIVMVNSTLNNQRTLV